MNNPEELRARESFLQTGARLMGSLFYDLRFALRTHSRRPGPMIVVIASLALGIAINVTAFTLLRAMFSPAVSDPDSLFEIPLSLTYTQHAELQDALSSQGELSEFSPGTLVSLDNGPRDVRRRYDSNNYFVALGLHPAAGMLFKPGSEARSDGERGAVPGQRQLARAPICEA